MDFTPKTLPNNLEAEQAVLAAILMDNRVLDNIMDFLLPDHFSHPAHKALYQYAIKAHDAEMPFDIITAKTHLEQQGILESVGGVEYLSKLAAASTTVVNVEHYAHIIFDNARRRDLIGLAHTIMDNAYVEDPNKSVNAQIEEAEQRLFNLSFTGQSERSAIALGDALKSAMEEAANAYKADGKLSGLTTGFDGLDKTISGLHHSNLLILAGRPGMGKTTLAMNIAFNAANAIYNGRANSEYKGAVVFFSLEMSYSELAARVLSSQSKIPSSRMRDGNLTDEDFMKMSEYSNALSKVPLIIDDTAGMSVPTLKARLRRIARRYNGIALIVIDYLQLMTLPGGKHSENRVQELSEITRSLKILAKEMDVPVIALSQLSRSVEQRDDKHPLLSDLRESGSIEQDADIVMFTYREEYYLEGHSPDKKLSGSASEEAIKRYQTRLENARNKAEVIIAKNRHGKTDTINMSFFGEYSLFDNLIQGPQIINEADNGFTIASTPSTEAPVDLSDISDDML